MHHASPRIIACRWRILNSKLLINHPPFPRLPAGGRYDNTYALKQIEEGHYSILSRAPATDADRPGPAKRGRTLPRVITLGGDHTITLPLLRSINRAYGPISVIHFDSHLDTCKWGFYHPFRTTPPRSA